MASATSSSRHSIRRERHRRTRRDERREPGSRLPEIRSFIAPLKHLSAARRATPLLYLELTGIDRAPSTVARRAYAECKRAVAAALRESIGSVLRASDLSAAGPGGHWFAVLLIGRAVEAKQRAALDDADLGIVAARLRSSVQAALSAAERAGKLPTGIAVRIGWSVVEPVAAPRAAEELRQSIRGAAVVARVEERRALVLGSITHELRTPLTSIVGYAEMLGSNGARKRDATRRRYAAIIVDEARRLSRLVEGLVDVGAWSTGKLKLRTVELRVEEVAAAARTALAPVAKARDVRCTIRGAATLAADRERLFQVLLNVLDNAIRHARPGGRVEMRITRDDRKCRIEVSDDGDGFDSAILKTLGEPFNAGAGASGRTGLGLAIARLLIEAHGGAIAADNPNDGGGRVTIVLPAAGFRYPKRSRRAGAGANTRL